MRNLSRIGAPGEIRTPDRLVRSRTPDKQQTAVRQGKPLGTIPDCQTIKHLQDIDPALPLLPLLGAAR